MNEERQAIVNLVLGKRLSPEDGVRLLEALLALEEGGRCCVVEPPCREPPWREGSEDLGALLNARDCAMLLPTASRKLEQALRRWDCGGVAWALSALDVMYLGGYWPSGGFQWTIGGMSLELRDGALHRRTVGVVFSGAPYRVKFSGNSSPHVVIRQEWYENLIPPEQREMAFQKLFGWIVKELSDRVPSWMDTSFGQETHLLRLPYSLNERTGLVSLPLRPEEFDAFEPWMAEAGRVQVADWWFEDEDLLAKQEGMARLLEEALGDGGN